SIRKTPIPTSITSYNIVVNASPTSGGLVTGGGAYAGGLTATVIATPLLGYSFKNWTENGVIVSSLASYSFTVTASRTLTANFILATGSYNITVSASPVSGGTVSGGGVYTAGSTATVVAAPYNSYAFKNWTENGAVVSSSPSYSFTVSGNRTLVANFVTGYTISVSSSPGPFGS